jgi:protein-tyrosine phosphatase
MFRGKPLYLLAIAALLAACAREPAQLPAEQRPLATTLPAAERAEWRRLPLAGAANFRDLGGYRTADGRQLKWGVLYRTDALNELTAEDQRYLERLNIERVVDFRLPDEAAAAPDRLPPALAQRYVAMPVGFNGQQNYAKFIEQIMSGDTEGLDLDQVLVVTNRQLVEQFSPVFRTWLHGVAESEGAQVFHCTAGKDRTGFAAAIVLLALGVPQETVLRDYLASNQYLAEKNQRSMWKMRVFSLFRADTDGIRPLLGVEPRYLQAAFDAMVRDYGSIDNYLRAALGVDDAFRARLQQRLLEPVAL